MHKCEHQCRIVDTNEEHSFGTSGSSIRYHSNYDEKVQFCFMIFKYFNIPFPDGQHTPASAQTVQAANVGQWPCQQISARSANVQHQRGGQLWNAAEFHRLLYGATFCWKWRCRAAYHFSGVENETEACVTCMPTRTRRITLRQHSTPKLRSGNSLYATCYSAVFCIVSGEHHFGTSSFIYIVHNCIGYLCYC